MSKTYKKEKIGFGDANKFVKLEARKKRKKLKFADISDDNHYKKFVDVWNWD